MSAVVVSWVVSPVLSGIVAVIFFGFARTFILRHDKSYERAFLFLPALVFICVFINALFVLDKGVDKQCDSPPPVLWLRLHALLLVAVYFSTSPKIQSPSVSPHHSLTNLKNGVQPPVVLCCK